MCEETTLFKIMQRFPDEDSARKYLEDVRWKNGKFCPKCGSTAEPYALKPKESSKRPVRRGVYKCRDCRKQFTVTVGTIFEASHIPLNKWFIAIFLMCASKKGISAHQIHRMLEMTYKSAWFMCHRIRYAMTQDPYTDKLKGVIEADETYVGGKGRGKRGRGAEKKTPVFTLLQRDGKVKSTVVPKVSATNLKEQIRQNVQKSVIIMTDEFRPYHGLYKEFVEHHVVNHGRGEYMSEVMLIQIPLRVFLAC